MFEEKHIPNRKVGEHLITFVRPHWLLLLRSLVFFCILLAIPIFLYYFISFTAPQVFTNETFYIISVFTGVLYMLVILLLLYNRFIDYHLDIWIVTNFRIIAIVQRNIFNRTISEHQLEKIQDVSANQTGFWQTFFDFGDVEVQTASEESNFHFDDIPKPFDVAKEINNLAHKHSQK
jgi:hypothetical protein